MLIDQILRLSVESPQRVAIIADDIPITYEKFGWMISRCRSFLSTMNLPLGSTVGILGRNLVECWVLGISLRSLGFDTVEFPRPKNIATIKLKEFSLLIGFQSCFAELNLTWDGNQAEYQGTKVFGYSNFDYLMAGDNKFSSQRFCPPESFGGHILLTSGTTGDFKKVKFESLVEDDRNRARAKAVGLSSETVEIIPFGTWTGAGFKQPSAIWHVGGTAIFSVFPSTVEVLVRSKANVVRLLPVWFKKLVSSCGSKSQHAALSKVKFCSIGAFMPLELAENVTRLLSNHLEISYSSTELIRPPLKVFFRTKEDLLWLSRTPDVQVQIVDENDLVCPPGVQGIIRIRTSDIDANSYLDDEETTNKFFRDGYFYPGDLAIERTDGRIRILGRVSDTINLQGKKTATAPIEQEVKRVLNVDDVCLFSYQDDLGEVIVAFALETQVPVSNVKLQEIANHFKIQNLRFVFFNRFPRVSSGLGKVRRVELKNLVMKALS